MKLQKEDEKSKQIEAMFHMYFDGSYKMDAVKNTSDTFIMGVCKLEYNSNTLTVHLRRPALLIGKGGSIIDALKKHLGCKIEIIEVNSLLKTN